MFSLRSLAKRCALQSVATERGCVFLQCLRGAFPVDPLTPLPKRDDLSKQDHANELRLTSGENPIGVKCLYKGLGDSLASLLNAPFH